MSVPDRLADLIVTTRPRDRLLLPFRERRPYVDAVFDHARDPAEVGRRYRVRYLPAQRLYEQRCRPAERAQVVLGNRDPSRPVVLSWPRAAGAGEGRAHGES